MGEPKKENPPNEPAVELTAAEAAKAVKRPVPETGKDGKPTGKTVGVALKPDEVLSFSLRGKVVTVVTTDGQKLVGAL